MAHLLKRQDYLDSHQQCNKHLFTICLIFILCQQYSTLPQVSVQSVADASNDDKVRAAHDGGDCPLTSFRNSIEQVPS